MKTDTETKSLLQVCQDLRLQLESSSPIGSVEGDWVNISYQCRLLRNGREVWAGHYRLGVGHVNVQKVNASALYAIRLTREEESLLTTWKAKPSAQFKDKQLQADVAAKIAKVQKVAPKLDDVVFSLMMDGSAYFNAQTFEDWCADYGYDADSIKAKKTYDICDEIGRKLTRAFIKDEIALLQEAAQNH